jgi:hypothetical protein
MPDDAEDRQSAVARLARLNEALRTLIAESEATDTLIPDDARDLAATTERLLATISEIRENPAANTPARLHALGDALGALLADIAGTPDPPR